MARGLSGFSSSTFPPRSPSALHFLEPHFAQLAVEPPLLATYLSNLACARFPSVIELLNAGLVARQAWVERVRCDVDDLVHEALAFAWNCGRWTRT